MHDQLRIVKGVQGAPGDTGTFESGYTVIDFLSGQAEGFALKTEPGSWNPAIAQPKAGLWYETQFTDGRVLFAGAEQNVTETMQITLTAPDQQRIGVWLKKLAQMQQDCQSFWESEGFFYDPVFLWWQATDAPGPQYALIYQIQIVVGIPTVEDANTVTRDITLTIEREPYWRGIPPGANPVTWTLYTLGKEPGLNYQYNSGELTLSDALSFNVNTALASGNLRNRSEIDYSASPNRYTARSQNWLTIPAASIPGDAPALVQAAVEMTTASNPMGRAFMAVRSGDIVREAFAGQNARFFCLLPAMLGSTGAVTVATAADTGGIAGRSTIDSSTVTERRVEITPSVTEGIALNFSVSAFNSFLQRGRFAVFMRCRQDSGSYGDIKVRLAVDNGNKPITPQVSAPLQAGTGNTSKWEMLYLGQVKLPLDTETTMLYASNSFKLGGTGINGVYNDLDLALLAYRSTGSAKLYVCDLIFMPLDEGFVDILSSQEYTNLLIDNTGYMHHGKPGMRAVTTSDPTTAHGYCEVQGQELTFKPGVDNTLYFLYRDANNDSNARTDFTIHVNIVPRWRYIRDV